MRRLGVLPLLFLALTAPAAAQTASLTDGGEAAFALERYDASGDEPTRAGIDVLRGDASGFAPATHIDSKGDLVGVVAQPDGSARVIMRVLDFDYRQPLLTPLHRLVSVTVGPDGTVGEPVVASGTTDVAPEQVRIASNGLGDVLLGWGTDDGGSYAAAGGPFSVVDVPGSATAAPAVAPSGAMLLAGSDAVIERPAGGVFGPPRTLPATNLMFASAGLASDGTAVVAGWPVGAAGPVAMRRPPGSTFQPPLRLADTPPARTAAAAVSGGRALVAWSAFGSQVVAIDAAGAVTDRREGPGHPDLLGLFMPTLAARDDGLAAIGIGEDLFVRPPGGGFDLSEDAETTATARVAVSAYGALAVGARTDGDLDPTSVTVRLNAQRFPLSLDARPVVAPHAVIGPGQIRVLDGMALVPVRCLEGTCIGAVSGREFGILEDTRAIVLVPVRRGQRQLRVYLRLGEEHPVAVTRSLDRGRRRCELPADARVYGRRGGFRLGVVTRGWIGSSRRMTEVAVCKPGRRAKTLAGGPSIVTAGLHGHRAATIRHAYYVKPPVPNLLVARVVDLRTNRKTDMRLPVQQGLGAALTPVEVLPVGQRTVVYTEQPRDGRARVMALVDGEARVLDAAEGIDPRSLAVAGRTVTWNRGSAEV